MTRPPEHTPDLSLENTLQEGLRTLFVLGADGMQLEDEDGTRAFLVKEHLIVLLERGLGEESLKNLLHHPEWCRSYRDARGSVAPEMRIVRLGPGGKKAVSAVSSPAAPANGNFPIWWSIPLPLLAQQNGDVLLNPHGEKLFPMGHPTEDDVQRALAQDHLMPWPGNDESGVKTFLLVPLTEGVYLLEDVSSDMALAEDVAWWAASGKALVAYFETQGYRLRSWRGASLPPEIPGEEVIACEWEGRLVGHMLLEAPPKPRRRSTKSLAASQSTPEEVDTAMTSPVAACAPVSRKKTRSQSSSAEEPLVGTREKRT